MANNRLEPTAQAGSMTYVFLVCIVAALGGLLFGYDTGVINGAIGPLISAWVAGTGMAGINIMGQKGLLVHDYTVPDKVQLKLSGARDFEDITVIPSDGFSGEVRDFLDAILNNKAPSCTAEDGLRAVEIICSLY